MGFICWWLHGALNLKTWSSSRRSFGRRSFFFFYYYAIDVHAIARFLRNIVFHDFLVQKIIFIVRKKDPSLFHLFALSTSFWDSSQKSSVWRKHVQLQAAKLGCKTTKSIQNEKVETFTHISWSSSLVKTCCIETVLWKWGTSQNMTKLYLFADGQLLFQNNLWTWCMELPVWKLVQHIKSPF